MSENRDEIRERVYKNVAFLTLGCKVNAYETDAMEKKFRESGYNIVTIDEIADIFVINTCSVTNMADRKSRQVIHRMKKKNEHAIIVATGCYVQTSKDKVILDECVDIAVGNNLKKNIVQIVEAYIKDNKEKSVIININEKCEYEDMSIESNQEHTRAYVKIQDGCNQFCSYCIIPYARGRIRSRKPESIIEEVETLAKNGYKEVVVTGIHLSSYGMDFEKDDAYKSTDYNPFMFKYLIDVLDSISKIEGIERIRLGSLEPRIITDEFLMDLSENKKICPHFHLSLQSGCDETLKRMNRKYTCDVYYDSLMLLRKYFDNPAVTTDVIVGFPGESEEEFSITQNFLGKCNFSMMHIFKYSRRKGTVADRMSNQVDDKIKTERSALLLDMTKKQHIEYMKSFIGKNETVLFEEQVDIDGSLYYIGHNERYVKIAVRSDKDITNQILLVEIDKVLNDDTLSASIV